ncbi:response regulator transcription factor [Nocardioides nitrophenolicus]|uniref:response regulator transcription factor n=1 Tax=Nocardioides nitrophenolicus TaxID=60489 RepID=UPI00195941AD|nr:response regulator transcription factor [Nocardioides nitrophenolicus]MBM7515634.1 DNA-binding response OmpR family regulator [Nocardioides nitrophenolicus]
MARVGVCEDDPAIRRVVTDALRLAGHEPLVAHDAGEAMRLFAAPGAPAELAALVLDIGLPDGDGRDLCQALRAAGQDAPVLFLTALDALHDRLAGFGAGADDYLVKPFAVKELLARVEVLARRGTQAGARDHEIRLDPTRHALVDGSGEVALSPTEFRILAALMARPGEVVRRSALVAAAWPDGAMVSENALDSYLRRVRRKLADVDPGAAITTARGVGYRFEQSGS